MSKNIIKNELNSLPDIACEKEDITCAMKDEAEFSRSRINDSLLRRYIKQTGDNRLNARTRKLIKIKSYDTYISLRKKLHKDLKRQVKELLLEVQE
jgi:hypothetical protein